MLQDKEILGRSALSLEAEPIISLKPDLVIEGVPPLKEDVRDHIEQAGIPVLQYWALHVDRTLPMIDDLGLILGKEERAKDLHHFIEGYYELATARLKNLSIGSQPSVYYMIMGQVSWTCGQGSDMGKSIEEAGGRNIAAGLPGNVPEVDPEWIIEQNPEIMVYHHIRQSESDAAIFSSLDELKERRDYVISQPGFDEIDAVKENRVFIIDSGIVTGPRQVIGFLHFAKWMHPQLFEDIDPEAIHKEMLKRFYDVEMVGSWAYP
ncbi:MAG: Cobalamin-binding protein precursor [Methanosaeta sp. PtaU1.Bin112]|nr:MAG: Cobalamin-binding protein precursor [Methanosaeta sp. PtaU1.Bin112]